MEYEIEPKSNVLTDLAKQNLRSGTMNFGGVIRLNKSGLIGLAACFLLLIVIYRTGYGSDDVSYKENKLVNLKEMLSAAIDAAERGGNKVFIEFLSSYTYIKVHLINFFYSYIKYFVNYIS